MRSTDTVDVFDVATAAQHVQHGDELLMDEPIEVIEALAHFVQLDAGAYYAYCQGEGMSLFAADEIWFWFHPDLYDGDLYHELRSEAPSEPPRA